MVQECIVFIPLALFFIKPTFYLLTTPDTFPTNSLVCTKIYCSNKYVKFPLPYTLSFDYETSLFIHAGGLPMAKRRGIVYNYSDDGIP